VTDRREIETETELSVSFADPDAAVDERIEELPLSAAARDIDDAVRSPDIADSNLRETVKSRLTEQIDEDPAALAPPETADSTAAETAADSAADETATEADDTDAETDDTDSAADDTDAAAVADSDEAADSDEPANESETATNTEAAGSDSDADTSDDAESDTTDGELSTMEDFL
jgi:hypothetical protein